MISVKLPPNLLCGCSPSSLQEGRKPFVVSWLASLGTF